MDERIASSLIDAELQRLRKLPYSKLVVRIGKEAETKDVVGADGKIYQIEIMAFRDSRKRKDVRLMVAADDGGLNAYKPLCGDFIMRPDGSIVV